MASRFVAQTAQTVDEFLQSEENKNTAYKTKRHIHLLKEYLQSTGEFREIHQIPPLELNEILSMFILSVRKKNGDEYEPATIRSIISSIDRHLKNNYYSSTIVSGDEFFKTRNVLTKKQKSLKKKLKTQHYLKT